jgi:hypothetical protein
MKDMGRFLWLALGLILGVVGAAAYFGSSRPAQASANDRYEDYIICTGPVAVTTTAPNAPTDGIWLLDYRAGKLLGTVIDRSRGKIVNWAEVDLVQEFNIPPKQNVHFMMTTGSITAGQAALYVAETSTGRFGIYTMGPRPDGRPGLVIRRHDLTVFRPQAPAAQ